VPLPDADGAVIETEYALVSLGSEGVVLLPNYEGRYRGDTCYRSLWQWFNAH
jgi:6-methylsalicylate decarboxylase